MIGKKVICVDDRFSGGVFDWTDQLPKLGESYTIRAVDVMDDSRGVPGACIKLEELRTADDRVWFSWWHFSFLQDGAAHEVAEAECEWSLASYTRFH